MAAGRVAAVGSASRRLRVFSGEICMEWDDYLRQQAATYRQLAEKAEDAVVKKELLRADEVIE